MRSRNIEVGKVGRVGLVNVVVDLEKGSVGGRNHGLEESLGAEFRRLAQDGVVADGV